MIRKSLATTKAATFAFNRPHPKARTQIPVGTCFFVSEDGYILTAYHVIHGVDMSKVSLVKPGVPHWEDPNWQTAISHVHAISLVKSWEAFDLAILKADFEANKEKDWARARDGFPCLPISFEQQEEGTPVYVFGYPLSDWRVFDAPAGTIGLSTFRERTTSAIIAASKEESGPIQGPGQPKHYVLDKALNYGNSGGPVVLTETGECVSVVVRFQPVKIPQEGKGAVRVPSLYGISSSLKNIENELKHILSD